MRPKGFPANRQNNAPAARVRLDRCCCTLKFRSIEAPLPIREQSITYTIKMTNKVNFRATSPMQD